MTEELWNELGNCMDKYSVTPVPTGKSKSTSKFSMMQNVLTQKLYATFAKFSSATGSCSLLSIGLARQVLHWKKNADRAPIPMCRLFHGRSFKMQPS